MCSDFLHLFPHCSSEFFAQSMSESFVTLECFVELQSSNFEYVDLHTENPKARSSGTALMRPLRCAFDRDSASTAHAAAIALFRLVSMLSRISPASLARFLGDRARATVASCFSSVGMSSRWQEKGRGQQSVLAHNGERSKRATSTAGAISCVGRRRARGASWLRCLVCARHGSELTG